MVKNILSVVVGYVIWTVIFLVGGMVIRGAFPAVHDEAGLTLDATTLGIYLAVSIVASLVAGIVTAKIAGGSAKICLWVLGFCLLATGVPVQLTAGAALPVWYNAAFLLLLIPVTILGGRLATPRKIDGPVPA